MLRKFIIKLRAQLGHLDTHSQEVVKKSSFTMLVKVFGMAGGVFVSIFIGRVLGPDGLGVINLANKIISVMLVFSIFGTKEVLVKHVSIGYENNDWQLVGSRIFTVTVITSLLAIVISVLGYSYTPAVSLNFFNDPDLIVPLQIFFIALLPQTLSRVFSSALIGFRQIWQSNLVNETLSMWFITIGLTVLYYLDIQINLILIALIYALGRIVVTITVYFYWKKVFNYNYRNELNIKPVIKMALPLLLVSSTSIIAANADTIMIGWLSTTKEVGLYNVAARLAMLVSLFLQVTNAAISPKLASLFEQGKIHEMQKMVRNVTSGLFVIALLFLVFFVVLGEQILGVWGNDFVEAYTVLVIIAVGQFFNISTGCAGLLLVMCGKEKIHSKISVTFIFLNLILNYALIIKFGAVGAAVATALTISLENFSKLFFARKKVGVLSLPNLRFKS